MYKNRDKKGRFIKGHKINVGKKNVLGPHRIRDLESFKRMRSEKMKGNKINLGRKLSEKTKRKLSEAKKGTNIGEKHPNWKGGICSNLRQYMGDYMKRYRVMYQERDLEKIRRWRKQYRQLHRERHNADNRKWRRNHEAKCYLLRKKYRASKKKAEGSHTLEEWELLKKQYDYKCAICGRREREIKLEEDHIIPLSKGGSNYIANIQPVCHSCNSVKGARIEFQSFKNRAEETTASNS